MPLVVENPEVVRSAADAVPRQRIDFGDDAHFRGVIAGLQELARLGLTTPAFVLYVRAKIGLYHLLHQLGSRVNGHKVYRKYV